MPNKRLTALKFYKLFCVKKGGLETTYSCSSKEKITGSPLKSVQKGHYQKLVRNF